MAGQQDWSSVTRLVMDMVTGKLLVQARLRNKILLLVSDTSLMVGQLLQLGS